MHVRARVLCALILSAIGVPAAAQSPNTATLVVVAQDQTGAAVPGAHVSIVNTETGAIRDADTGAAGSATLAALSIAGAYRISITQAGFVSPDVDVTLRAGETGTIKVQLIATGGKSAVTVYGTAQGVQTDPQLGTRLDSERIDETPLLGRKVSFLPLLNAGFRQAKGTGDLFMNSIYFVTGAGGRRQASFAVDGASGNEPWGRQTMFSTIPVGAIQEMTVSSHAFSAEFGWTASAAVNIVTKSGTNVSHGEAVYLARPARFQKATLGTDAQCPTSISTCVAPTTATGSAVAITPADVPDVLKQGSFAYGGPITKDQTHFFLAADVTAQDRTALLTSPLRTQDTYVGNYRQALVDARIDRKVSVTQTLMVRFNLDRFHDTNPQDVISGNTLPALATLPSTAGRQFTRHSYSMQVSDTMVLGPNMLNEARFEFQNADPVTQFEPLASSTQYRRITGTAQFTVGESSVAHIYSREGQFSDTLSWTRNRHYFRMGGNVSRSTSGGDGTEFGSPKLLGLFTFGNSTKTFDQLTLADVQNYTQGFNFGIGTYVEEQWLYAVFLQDSVRVRDDVTLDLGVRYDRQTFSDGKKNLAPRVGFGWNPAGDPKTAVRGGYGMYFTQLRSNTAASFELNGPEGIGSYTATPSQTGFPTCLTCTPVVFNLAAGLSTLPARDVTIRPGMRDFYTSEFAKFGVDFSKVPNYPDAFVNPKSQVGSIGIEHEIAKGVVVSADYVKQHWTGLDRSVDLNAPAAFDRTAPGQVRTVAAANLTRPILPVNGGFRQITVIENLGVADYDGLQMMVRYRGSSRMSASVSYTLSSATNTSEPDGNGINPSDPNVSRLGEQERGPSLLDQRHRAVISLSYLLPFNITAGTVTQLASARAINATTGVDNNGDGANNDRPVVNGLIVGKSTFRGTPTSDVSIFVEGRLKMSGRTVLLRVEGFNLLNHANVLARNGVYGDALTPSPTFGQATAGLAAVDPGRTFQFQVRFQF